MKIGGNTGIILARSRALRQARSRAMGRSHINTSGRLSGNNRSNVLKDSLNRLQYGSSTSNLSTVGALQARSNYLMIERSAGDLQDYAKKLLETGEDSLFGKALSGIEETASTDKADGKENSDKTQDADSAEGTAQAGPTQKELEEYKEKVVNEITNFLDSYNTMVERMGKLDDTTQAWYQRELKSYVSENRAALSGLGITQNSDGTLKVNKSTLKNADVEKMKKVFGEKNCFADKVSRLAKNIGASAEAGLNKLSGSSYTSSSNYNRYGSALDSIIGSSGSRYNARG